MDLEYQRLELIQFNLFDNSGTYAAYLNGRGGEPGAALRWWPTEMRLQPDHPQYEAVGGVGEQVCAGDLVRARTLTGICNDVPLGVAAGARCSLRPGGWVRGWRS